MRSGELRKDGSIEISTQIQTHLTDLNRYLRFKAGQTMAEIAIDDRVLPETVKTSVLRGRKAYESEQILVLRDLKYTSAVEGEKIRTETRIRVAPQIIDGLELLLKGKRVHVSVQKSTGEFLTMVVDDPEMISMGLEHARKILSLDERPAQNQTVVNIQNNQQNINESPQGSSGLSYEERLKRIRGAQQKSLSVDNNVIDVTPEPEIVVNAQEPEAPAMDDEKWGDF